MTGILYGVGVGPGDAELMTLKAVRIIRESEAIAVPKSGDGEGVAYGIARQAVPELEAKQILEVDMPMTRDPALLRASHVSAAERIIEQLQQGINVSFLTLGDPTIYSTYIYVHRIVREKGYKAEIISGVPSICAVSAKLGDSLVDTSEPLHIIPGSYGCLKESLALSGTKVLMKSGKSFPEVKSVLLSMGLLDTAKMVVNCGMDSEQIFESLAETDDTSGYFSVIVVKDKNVTRQVVGE